MRTQKPPVEQVEESDLSEDSVETLREVIGTKTESLPKLAMYKCTYSKDLQNFFNEGKTALPNLRTSSVRKIEPHITFYKSRSKEKSLTIE